MTPAAVGASGERRRVPVVVDLSRDVVRAEPFGRERTAVNMDACDRRARIRLDERQRGGSFLLDQSGVRLACTDKKPLHGRVSVNYLFSVCTFLFFKHSTNAYIHIYTCTLIFTNT